jgi:V/A-type H+-transporting ATPase subunit C
MAGMPVEGLASATGQARIGTFVGAADDWLMSYLRDAKNVPFGPERVFGYLVGLEAESYNLRLVLGGRVRGISPERLQGRLRSCYL